MYHTIYVIVAADKFDTRKYVLKERNVKADERAVLIVRVVPSLPFSFSLSLPLPLLIYYNITKLY